MSSYSASDVHVAPVASKRGSATWPAFSIVLLLVLAVLLPPGFMTGMNLCLLFLAAMAWLGSGEQFDRNLLRAIAPFLAIAVVGLLGGIGADRYLYLKDAWYVTNPAIIICVGYVLYRNKPDLARGLRAFVIGGTLLALLHFTVFIRHPEVLSLSAYKLREAVGTGYYAIALAFTVLCVYFGRWRENLQLPNWFAVLLLVICSTGVAATFSRTMVIIAAIGVAAAFGFFARQELPRTVALAIAALAAIVVLNLSLDLNSDDVRQSFLGKIARSVEELSVDETSDIRSINLNWRGYETSRAFSTYAAGNPVQWLTGQGFGKQVDLGLFMPLGTSSGFVENIRFAPVLHNGYAYLLVKGGPISIALFMYSMIWLYRVGRKRASGPAADAHTGASRLMQSIALSLVFATIFISGVFNKLDMFPHMLAAGFLIGALTDRKLAGS